MITIRLIQERTAAHYGITLDDLNGPRRLARIAWARQVAMYLARELLGFSYPHLAAEFGKKEHGTIMWGCQTVAGRIEVTPTDREQVESLRLRLRHEGACEQVPVA